MDVAHLAFATIEQWMEISGDRRSTVYEKLGDGRLRGIKDGKRTKIDVQHGLQHLRSLPVAQIRPAKKPNADTDTAACARGPVSEPRAQRRNQQRAKSKRAAQISPGDFVPIPGGKPSRRAAAGRR